MSLGWFQSVGLLIGLSLALIDALCRDLFPLSVATALVLTASIVLTGALHLDGLADSADGLFGGHTTERRLEIMKDSRTGAFGVVAVGLALLLQYAALGSLTGFARTATLIAAPMLARTGMALSVVVFPYARTTGLGRLYKDHASVAGVIASFAVSGMVVAIFGLGYALMLPIAAAAALLVGVFASRRLGGLTGDVYGAIGVVTEAALFVAAAGLGERWLGDSWLG